MHKTARHNFYHYIIQYIKQQFKYAYSSTVNTLTVLQWLAFEPYQACMSAYINAYIINMHA